MSYQQIETLQSLTARQFLQWKFIFIHQSKFQETVRVNWNCLLLFASHVVSTSRAEHTTSYRSRATTSFISYHQLKTCYLKTINLNLGRKCGQTEIVCHWSLLMSLKLAEQSIQLLTCHISKWRLCHRTPQDNQSKSWKKVDLCFFISLITSHAIRTSRAEHTTSYRSRATTSFIS
jgi:hypothetical protein